MENKFFYVFFLSIALFLATIYSILSISDETIVTNGSVNIISFDVPFQRAYFSAFAIFIVLINIISGWKGTESEDFRKVFPFWNSMYSNLYHVVMPFLLSIFFLYVGSKTHNICFIGLPLLYIIVLFTNKIANRLIKMIVIFIFVVVCTLSTLKIKNGQILFLNIQLSNCKIILSDYVYLNNSNLNNVIFSNVEILNKDFSHSKIINCKFKEVDNLINCNFSCSLILETEFTRIKLIENCNFDNIITYQDSVASYNKVKFDSTQIINTSFNGAKLSAVFNCSELNGIFDEKSEIVRSTFNSCNLSSSKGLSIFHINNLALNCFDSSTKFPAPLNDFALKRLRNLMIRN